ncbi:MAG: DUF2141 domain-containing protein [Bacteroidales bacterium]|nr:DUF2141 domain-containing protein [Bacteroidales bacterium]
MMKSILFSTGVLLAFLAMGSFSHGKPDGYSLSVAVKDLRNSKGQVQFVLYNKENSIPDEHYNKFYRRLSAKIVNGTSSVTFENLPEGNYAVNVLHDENSNSKIDKGLFLPKEGIGFSNFENIGFANRPDFKKASLLLNCDKRLEVRIIYL